MKGMGLGWKASCSHLRHFPCCALGQNAPTAIIKASVLMRSADFAPAGRNRRLLVEGMGLGWKASCSPPAAVSLLRIRTKTS